MESSTWKRYDITGLIIAIILCILAGCTTFMRPTPLYFPPNDSNSDFPAKDSTIPTWLVAVLVAVIGAPTIIGLYFLALHFPNYFKKFNVFSAIWNLLIAFGATMTCVNIFKNMVGRARPDLFAKCGDDVTADPKSCPALKESKFYDEYRSWPSGHSATSFSTFGFLGFFVQKTITCLSPLSTFIACLFYTFAIYIGSTRIVDFRHHPDDVIAGFFIGFVFVILVWQRAVEDIYDVEDNKVERTEQTDSLQKGDDPL